MVFEHIIGEKQMKKIKFNVIVTCATTAKVLSAIERKDVVTGYHKRDVGGFQVMFDMSVVYQRTESRYAIMQRLKQRVMVYMREKFGLNEDALKFVSTSADWKTWARETGRNYVSEHDRCKKYKNGKFVYKGFYKEWRWIEKAGVDLNYWSIKVLWEHAHKGQSFEMFIREAKAKKLLSDAA
jgi:hypothetical protein